MLITKMKSSLIALPHTKRMQASSALRFNINEKRETVAIILTDISHSWDTALLKTLLTAEKYPFITEEIDINGKQNAKILRGRSALISPSQ